MRTLVVLWHLFGLIQDTTNLLLIKYYLSYSVVEAELQQILNLAEVGRRRCFCQDLIHEEFEGSMAQSNMKSKPFFKTQPTLSVFFRQENSCVSRAYGLPSLNSFNSPLN